MAERPRHVIPLSELLIQYLPFSDQVPPVDRIRSMFPPSELPSPGQLLLVTDELPSPADFLLHRFLTTHLKETEDSLCVVLSVSENLARWKAIASKSNISLSQPQDSFIFVDVSSKIQAPSSRAANDSVLRLVFDQVCAALSSVTQRATLVILDDITTLEWIGLPTLDLIRFSRALRALCLKSKASLVIRHHIVTPAEPDDLFRHLLQVCAYHLDVRPLSSGRSGAVSGEVALHAGPSVGESKIPVIPRSRAVQYRLTDAGAVFFERGTGGGVL